MVGITPPVENAYSVKTATNFLGIPFSQQKHDSLEAAGKGKNGYSLMRNSAFASKVPNQKGKLSETKLLVSSLWRTWICATKLEAFHFPMKSQYFTVIFMGTLILFQEEPHQQRGKKAAREKFHLIIPSPFPSFHKDVHSQALQCNYRSKCLNSPFLSQWEKLSTVAWHLLFL